MRIEIAARLQPFSHTPGAKCLIPGTHEKVVAYPTLLKVGECEVELHVTGPVEGFTLQQDLEKNCVWVWGRAKEGFYRLKVEAGTDGIGLVVERASSEGLKTSRGVLQKGERVVLTKRGEFYLPAVWERLSLGSHKSQDWDLVWRRFELREILPVLFGLGQKTPPVAHVPESTRDNLESFCRAAFSHILVPRLIDEEHQGLNIHFAPNSHPSAPLLEATRWIRSLFFQSHDRHLRLLPHLPFEAGRMLCAQAPLVGELDLEWRKGLLHRAILRASGSGEVLLELQKKIKSYRVRKKLSEKGTRRSSRDPFTIESGQTHYLDQFKI